MAEKKLSNTHQHAVSNTLHPITDDSKEGYSLLSLFLCLLNLCTIIYHPVQRNIVSPFSCSDFNLNNFQRRVCTINLYGKIKA